MPNDIEDLFASLAADADRATLPPSAEVRRRSDRRVLTRSVAGVAAVVLLVAGIAAGTRVVAGPDHRTPAGPVTSAPWEIPNQAFLQAEDLPFGLADGPTWQSGFTLGCTQPSDRLVRLRGAVTLTYRDQAGLASGSITETIQVYRSDGARDLMYERRRDARDCADFGGFTRVIVGDLGVGDDSMLVELTADGPVRAYEGVVRSGDRVAVVQVTGAEPSTSASREDAVQLARAAARRLAEWR